MRSKKIKMSQRVKRSKRVKRKRVKRTRRNTKTQRGGMKRMAATAAIGAGAGVVAVGGVPGAIVGTVPAMLGTAYLMRNRHCACLNPNCVSIHDGEQIFTPSGKVQARACSCKWTLANSSGWKNNRNGWFCPNCSPTWGQRVGRPGGAIFSGAENATSPLGISSIEDQKKEFIDREAKLAKYNAAEEHYATITPGNPDEWIEEVSWDDPDDIYWVHRGTGEETWDPVKAGRTDMSSESTPLLGK
jgi:hypothetical protein